MPSSVACKNRFSANILKDKIQSDLPLPGGLLDCFGKQYFKRGGGRGNFLLKAETNYSVSYPQRQRDYSILHNEVSVFLQIGNCFNEIMKALP